MATPAGVTGTPTGPEFRLVAIIPVFNGAESLSQAAASVLRQAFDGLGLLFVDDGSTDDSPTLEATIASGDARVRVARSPVNRGLAATLNLGLREVHAPLVLLLHQDCELRGVDWVSRAVGRLEADQATGVLGRAFHNVGAMTPLERVFWVVRAHTGATALAPDRPATLTLFSENKCDLYRRDALLEVGGFDESFRTGGEDQLMALKLEQSGRKLLAPDDLWFDLTLGSDRQLGRGLHKELRYGQQMRSVLLRSRGRAARRSATGRWDPRLRNRVLGLGWVVATLGVVVAGVVLDRPWLLLAGFLPPAIRAGVLAVRGVRERRAYALRTRDIAAVPFLGLLLDLVYAVGLITPDPRRTAAAEKPAPPTAPPVRSQGQ